MRIFAAIAALMLITSSSSAAEQLSTLEQIKQTGKIRIGYRQSEPPMSFRDNDGNPVGYSIDLCTRITTAVKTKLGMADLAVDYIPINSQNRFTALVENKIDILCGSTTKTLSRSELVDFSQLTFATGASLMSLREAPVDTVTDLQGKKVAVVRDTTTAEALKSALKETLTDAEVILADSAAQGFNMLREGEVNAYSSDQVVLIGLVVTSENPKTLWGQ